MKNGIDYLTPEKATELLSIIKRTKQKLIVLLMMDCGLRVSECITLKVSNFDFKKKLLTVVSLKKRPKGKKPETRTLPISNRLYHVLAEYIHRTKIKEMDDYLFPSPHGKDPHITRFAVFNFLDGIRKKHSGFSNLHPHTLRHTFATNLLAQDSNLVHIQKALGHKDLNATSIYTHVPTEILRQKIEKSSNGNQTFIEKLLSKIYKPKARLININPISNRFVVGRSAEIQQIQHNQEKGINTLLLGDIGTGKTALLDSISTDKKILRIDDVRALKTTLVNTLQFIYKDNQALLEITYPNTPVEQLTTHLSKHSQVNLAKEIVKASEGEEYIMIVDNVDGITPTATKILEIFKDRFTIITSARNVPVNRSSFLWNFDIIKMKNMPRSEALDMIYRLSYDLEVSDPELLRNHIYEQSDGNPRAIFEMVERYRKEPFIDTDTIRHIKHLGSRKEIDMSLFVLVILGGMAILRYLSMETGESSMRFFGGAAMVLLIVFRYLFSFTKRRYI